MAKEYTPPNKKTDDDENEKLKQHQQNNPQVSSRVQGGQQGGHGGQSLRQGEGVDQYNDQDMKEQREASEKAAKERDAYMNEINRRISEVVDFAGKTKDTNPQMMNLTAEALKNAACQIEAATPQGGSHKTQPL
jgi:hypothetical protein